MNWFVFNGRLWFCSEALVYVCERASALMRVRVCGCACACGGERGRGSMKRVVGSVVWAHKISTNTKISLSWSVALSAQQQQAFVEKELCFDFFPRQIWSERFEKFLSILFRVFFVAIGNWQMVFISVFNCLTYSSISSVVACHSWMISKA